MDLVPTMICASTGRGPEIGDTLVADPGNAFHLRQRLLPTSGGDDPVRPTGDRRDSLVVGA